jgi:hypothetical protein
MAVKDLEMEAEHDRELRARLTRPEQTLLHKNEI